MFIILCILYHVEKWAIVEKLVDWEEGMDKTGNHLSKLVVSLVFVISICEKYICVNYTAYMPKTLKMHRIYIVDLVTLCRFCACEWMSVGVTVGDGMRWVTCACRVERGVHTCEWTREEGVVRDCMWLLACPCWIGQGLGAWNEGTWERGVIRGCMRLVDCPSRMEQGIGKKQIETACKNMHKNQQTLIYERKRVHFGPWMSEQ